MLRSAIVAGCCGPATPFGWRLRIRRSRPVARDCGWQSVPVLIAAALFGCYIVHFPLVALASAWAIQSYGGRPLHGWFAVAGAVACVSFGFPCFELCERHFLHPRYRDDSAAP